MKLNTAAFSAFAFCCLFAPGRAADPEAEPVSGFQFELLPRAFQKNPFIDTHVITEMTDAGRKQSSPTAAQPAYYVTRSGGQLALGLGVTAADEKPVDVKRMEELMSRALAVSHYLPASEGQNPGIVIIYSWGSHSAPLGQNDASVNEDGIADTGESKQVMIKEMLERAKLIGGEKFTRELVKAMTEESAMRTASVSLGMFSPMEKFRNRNVKTMALLDDAGGSIYFVVASAYEANSVATNNRTLLWRTKMSTRASGINLVEALPTLVSTAAPYFGKDMGETESVRLRVNRDGTVKLAPLEVLGYDSAPGKDAPAPDQAGPGPAGKKVR